MQTNLLVSMLLIVILVLGAFGRTNGIGKEYLDAYTWRIGNSLFNHSRTATKYRDLHKKFEQSDSKVVPINLEIIFSEVGKKMNESLRKKVDAIEKLMVFAEEKAFDQYKYNRSSKAGAMNVTFSKSLKVTLTPDEHFQTSVNTGFSSVHVPTSIFDQDKKLLEAVSWSSDLDDSFKSNYKENPTLSWQYFGSSTGFLRHYPAMKWPNGDPDAGDDSGEDLYDCRVRPWYVGAANSPKNIVILQDVSGSMTGLRSLISRHVIHTVLDTLTENDFVNVYNFSSNSTALVDCFKGRLVQANLENIREFKIALGQGGNQGFAEFAKGYETAFDILEQNYNEQSSSQCNQAIILITDGCSEYYQQIFDKRNPLKKIRVFTFLIGREVTDHREVKWMACYNRGHFEHISTMGEVQEKVLNYLPFMSRPLVMSEKHHVSWSPVYADMAEIIESDWQWEERTRVLQKERSERYKIFYRTYYIASRKNNVSILADFVTQEQMENAMNGKHPYPDMTRVKNFLDHGETNVSESLVRIMRAEKERNNIMIRHKWREHDPQFRQFSFVVSASIPVFDRRKTNSSNKNARIANFHGVVGTDIPIKELQKITSPFYLGVNGYAFAITNNGHIIFHPDWRPLYEDILKPNYNTVDLTEVELLDSDDYLRNRGPSLIEMRKAMIDKETQNSSNSSVLHIRSHSDNFRRVKIRKQQYGYGKIDGTSYTLALVVPMNANRFVGSVEIWRLWKDRKPNYANVTKYFDSPNTKHKWRLNPNWSYCEYIGSSDTKFNENKEVLLIHFLQRIQQSNYSWAWTATNASRPYICDKDLVQSLVFDAELTQKFGYSEGLLRSSILGNATVMTFVATRSGLTRWVDFDDPESVSDIPFMEFYGKATEELWYRRAVDWNDIDEEIVVYTVPFDAGTRSYAQITAAQAIFVKKGPLKAPVAVVGIQYDMDKVISYLNFSMPTGRGDPTGQNVCQGDEYDCFFLDDNGFVIISENREDIGQFFGEVDGKLMEVLLKAGIYDEIAVTDFQAVCLHPLKRTSFADILATPLQHMKWILRWFLGRLAWLILQSNVHMFISPDYASVLAEAAESAETQEIPEGSMPYINEASVPKTKLRRCDKKYNLYTFGPEFIPTNGSYRRVSHDSCHQSCNDFLNVRRVPRSNLLLVVVQAKCRCGNQKLLIKGEEILYPMHPDFEGRTDTNPILLELCRIPYHPLHRKRTTPCYAYNPEEDDIMGDCGNDSTRLELTCFLILTTVLVQRYITVHYYFN